MLAMILQVLYTYKLLLLLLLFVKGKKAEPVIPYRLQKLTVSMYNISLLSM